MNPRPHQMIAPRLGGGVRTVWSKRSLFVKGHIVRSKRAIDLVRGDVKKTKLVFLCPLQRVVVRSGRGEHNEGAVDIGLQKGFRAKDRTVYMALRSEMNDGAWLVLVQKLLNQGQVADISVYKDMPRIVRHGSEIPQVARVSQLVEINDATVSLREPMENIVRSDESGTAGDEDGIRHAQAPWSKSQTAGARQSLEAVQLRLWHSR